MLGDSASTTKYENCVPPITGAISFWIWSLDQIRQEINQHTNVACAGNNQPVAAAVDAARHADATVVVTGLDQKVEAEGLDRSSSSLFLSSRQAELISAVAKASKGPVVLVLMSGGPLNIAFAQNVPRRGDE
ncbi:hypothetical protein BAE44_0000342 [Dichanthelium oligosanthes]|uniref:Glycoside hydrolase family 3 C-terminal domain-containing protein n=1 Tax=Dichanthelium oligosanthes TaxID=888268 RepID=A0A1E5WMM4_9POAL|nr:hypothetical protein BAE44_0000342 [Dichanthelium oligosanthes]